MTATTPVKRSEVFEYDRTPMKEKCASDQAEDEGEFDLIAFFYGTDLMTHVETSDSHTPNQR